MKNLLVCFFALMVWQLFPIIESNSLLDAGISDYNKGQYSFALNNLKKYIQIIEDNTEKPRAYYYISLSYYFLDNYKLSLHYFDELITRFRYSGYSKEAYFWKGLIYQNLNQWQDAEAAFFKYINSLPNSDLIERAYLALANSEMSLNKYAEAEKNLKILINNFPKSAKYEEASVLYAYILLKGNKYKEATEFLNGWNEKLDKTGGDYRYKDRFWLYQAEIFFMQGKYETARILLKKIDNYAGKSPSSDIALLRLSEIEEILGNTKESKAYLVRLANEYPDSQYNIDALLSMGTTSFNKKEYSDAAVFFKQVEDLTARKLKTADNLSSDDQIRLRKLSAFALFYLGEISNLEESYAKALEYYNRVLETEIDLKYKSLIRIMEISIKQNNTDRLNKILTQYGSAIQDQKEYRDSYFYYKAKLEYLNKNYQQALQIIQKIENKTQFGYPATVLQANCLIQLNRNREAVQVFEEIYPVLPLDKKAGVSLDLVSLYFNLGDYSSAVAKAAPVNAFLSYASDDEQLKIKIKTDYYLALSYMQLKNNKKGIDILDSLTKSYIQNKSLSDELTILINQSFYYLGWMYYKESLYNKSADAFGVARQLNRDEQIKQDAYYMEAWSYFSNRDYSNAAVKFQEIYKLYYPAPFGIKAYYQLGKSYENLNNRKDALAIYNKIYYQSPDSPYKADACYELIQELFRQKELAKADQLMIEFNAKFPDSPLYADLLLSQAETLTTLKRYSEALSIYTLYLKKYPDRTNLDLVYFWGGYCAAFSKDNDTARNYYNRIVENYPDSPFYINALNNLQAIYQEEKNYKQEEIVLKKILQQEKDSQKIAALNKRLKQINMIKSGTAEEEALLLSEAESGTAETRFNLALYYYENNQQEKSLLVFQELSVKDTKIIGSKACLILADYEYDNRRYEDAIKAYLKTVSYQTLGEIKAEALYKAALTYDKTDQDAQAKLVIDKLKNSFAESKWTEKALELEKRLKP